MIRIRDEFLSEEDLDLKNLSEEELIAYWNLWLEQAQVSNELDQYSYSHGVFVCEPQGRKKRRKTAVNPRLIKRTRTHAY
jgi:hypothetical protein